MPHSIFFTEKGHAIHGSFETKRLGSAVSHGCVRISPAHATALFSMVKADGMANTRVIVSGGDNDGMASRRRNPREPDETVGAGGYVSPAYIDQAAKPAYQPIDLNPRD